MRIKYIHISEPEKTKTHDTEKVRKNTFHYTKTQKEVDELTLKNLKRDLEKGIILHYEILEG